MRTKEVQILQFEHAVYRQYSGCIALRALRRRRMMETVLKIDKKDNLVTCLRAVKKGETITVDGKNITVNQDVPQFHKIAVENIAKGETCYKYGQVIGKALCDIKEGDYVHVHNIISAKDFTA